MPSLIFHGATNASGHTFFNPRSEAREVQRFSPGLGFSCNFRVSNLKNSGRELVSVGPGRKFAGGLRVSSCLVTDSVQEEASSLKNEMNVGLGFDGGSRSVIEAEAKYFVGNYARSPVVFVRGQGCKLYDMEGKEYLDLTAGIAVNALGHGDPAWVQAVMEQAATLTHVSNVFHTIPQKWTLKCWSWHAVCRLGQ